MTLKQAVKSAVTQTMTVLDDFYEPVRFEKKSGKMRNLNPATGVYETDETVILLIRGIFTSTDLDTSQNRDENREDVFDNTKRFTCLTTQFGEITLPSGTLETYADTDPKTWGSYNENNWLTAFQELNTHDHDRQDKVYPEIDDIMKTEDGETYRVLRVIKDASDTIYEIDVRKTA